MFKRALRTSPSHDRRWWKGLAPIGVALALVAAPMAFMPVAADAASSTTLAGSPFNGSNGVLDTDASIGAHDDVGTPDTFAGGVKEDTDCPPTDGGGAPSKADILTGWVGNANGTVLGVDHTFLYLGWSRPSAEGTATIDFELNSGTVSCGAGSPFLKRVPGSDLLFTYDFQGGSTVGVSVRTWTAGGWSAPTTLPATKAEASISDNQLFGELVVDMTAAGFFAAGVCKSFSSAMVKSRASSSSFENQVKDLILPFPVEVTNCGSLTVTKTVVGGGANDSFQFTVDCGTFDLNGPDVAGDDLSFSLANGGSKKIDDIPLGKVCSAAETNPGAASWTTTYKIGSGSSQTGLTASGIGIVLGNTTVAYTNTRKTGTLTVNKVLSPSTDAGKFNLQIDGGTAGTGGNVGNGGTTGAITVNTGSHSFGETAAAGTDLANYVVTSSCLAGEVSAPIVDGAVTVGQNNVVCTITNTRKTGTLTVTKVVSPAGDPGLFNLRIDGATKAANVGDGGTTGAVTLNTGSHSFGETAGTGTSLADYTATTACVDANGPVSVSDGSVTLAFGENVVCTITNTRITGSLTVSKTTTGGTGTFKFDVVCDNGFETVVTIENTGVATIDGIPTRTSCTVTERANPLFSSIVFPTDGTVVIDREGQTVAFTNTRNTGPLTITKTAIGGTGTFTFDVDCSDNAFDQVITIVGSGSQTILGIPTTTTCTVTERSNPLFTTSVLPADGTVSIDAGGANVAFVNTAKPNGLTLDKKVNGGDHATTGDALLAHAGDSLTYAVVITNNGQVPMTITLLSDPLYPAIVAACPQAVGSVLAVGASFTCTYKVAATGDEHNVATVGAVDGLDRPITASDGTYVDVIRPAVSIVKTANPVSITGSAPVTYTYVVTNTGDVVLHDIVVNDDILGLIGSVGSLAAGESLTLSKTVTVDTTTPPTNIGTVVGTDILGKTVTAADTATITAVLGVELVVPQVQPTVAPATATPQVLPLTELPRTGAPLGTEGRAGIILLQAGLALWFFGRRRRQVDPMAD